MLINVFESDRGIIVEINPLCQAPEKKLKVKGDPILMRADEIYVSMLLETDKFPQTMSQFIALTKEIGGFEILPLCSGENKSGHH
jgi:hypothetical protein